MRPPDLSARDAATHVAMTNLLRRRPGVPLELFYEYWSGGHTQISSRLPGIHQYWQHHLSYEDGAPWPTVDGVDRHLPEEHAFQGDAEITYLDSDALARFVAALGPLMQDEQNVFEETISYQSLGANARTYVDRIVEDSPNGDLGGVLKFLVYVRRANGVELEPFRDAVRERVAPAIASSAHVLKLRLRLPEVYDNDAVTLSAPNVSNRKPLERQYQACLEVAFASPLELRRFAGAAEWRDAAAALAGVAGAAHALRALRTFTVYNHGRITTAGLRTPQVAEQIRRLGAVNQLGDEVLELVLGPHPQHGLARAEA